MDDNEVINNVGARFINFDGDLWNKARDVVWFKRDQEKPDNHKERFGNSQYKIMDNWNQQNRPRFVNAVLDLIVLAQQVLDEED